MAADVVDYLRRRGLLEQARAAGWGALPPFSSQAALLHILAEERRYLAEERAAIQQESGCPTEAPVTREEVLASGLFSRGGFAHPEARLVVPWRRHDGLIVNVQRRRLDAGEPRYVGARGRAFTWPYGVEHVQRATGETTIALVEGAIDALALGAICQERHEDVIVLGVPGTGAWRAAWGQLVRDRVVALGFDNDAAGERLAVQLAGELVAAGARRIERWTPPDAKDWSDSWTRRTT
jgi:DNA primase